MFLQQRPNPVMMPTAAALLQEIERLEQNGYSQSNLVSIPHFILHLHPSKYLHVSATLALFTGRYTYPLVLGLPFS